MNLLEALKPALNSPKGALPCIVPDSPKWGAKTEREREARNDEQLLQRGRVGWRAASDGTVKGKREENEAERHGN